MKHRRAGLALALLTIGAASFALGRAHAARAAIEDAPLVVAASAPARSCGVHRYRIERSDRRSVHATWDGGAFTSSGDAAHTLQRIELGEGSFELETTPSRVVLRRLSHDRAIDAFVAETDDAVPPTGHGRRWRIRSTPERETMNVLRTIAAIDVDLAVQGSSLVYGGRVHTSCTLECMRAAECAPRAATAPACIESIDLCGGCMVQAP